MDLVTHRRRTALFFFFLIPGLSISSWVTRTPDIRDQLGASTAQMGMVLFGLSVGSMIGILGSGAFVARFGTRPVMGTATFLVPLSLVTIGSGAALSSTALVTAGLFLFGAGMGGGEVAINIDGADVEQLTQRTILPSLHGFFSLGTVVGATIGILCTALSFPVLWHMSAVAVITTAMLAHAIRHIPAAAGMRQHHARTDTVTSATKPWKDRRLLLIGGIILAMALAEGSANDWLPLLMVDGHGMDPAMGSAVYTGFAAAMTIGRFAGAPLISRLGRSHVVRGSAISASVGIALVVFTDSAALAAAAVLLWGLGASLGFPLTLSAAGDSGPDSTARVSLVAMIGYIAFLVGPPSLGFLGDHYGLRTAMIAVLAFTALAVLLAPAVGKRSPAASTTVASEATDVPVGQSAREDS